MEQLTLALQNLGYEHLVVYGRGQPLAGQRVASVQVRDRGRFGNVVGDLRFGAHVKRCVRSDRADIVHTHGDSVIARAGARIAASHRAPHVHTVHARLPRGPAHRRALWPLFPSKSFYVAVSRDVARDLTAAGVRPTRILTRPSGVRDQFLGPSAVRRSPIIVAGGRLIDSKRVREFAEAWFSARIDDVRLIVVGDGPDAAAIREISKRCSTVEFRGRLGADDLATLLHRAAVGLVMRRPRTLSESGEGTPTLALEMFAAGCWPVVTQDAGEAVELVVETGWGSVSDGLPDPSAVAEAARRWSRPDSVEKREIARRLVIDRHSWPAVAEELSRLYRRAASHYRAGE